MAQIARPMMLSWLPNTSQGRMFGDYTSTSVRPGGNGTGARAGARSAVDLYGGQFSGGSASMRPSSARGEQRAQRGQFGVGRRA